ncbi:MAG: hypothetical protein PUP92_08535 [Rhizonema sp. PD38]|nr:hypothetical protein [Rhizonema sp. PD38]
MTGCIIGGRLNFDWTFSIDVYQQSIVKRLAQSFVEVIQSLITSSQSVSER